MLAWSNLKQGLLSPEAAYALVHSIVFSDFYKSCFYSAAGIILLFLVANLALRRFGPSRLSKLSEVDRVVFITHIAFFLIFLGTVVPYTLAVFRVLFTLNGIRYLIQASTYRCVAYPLSLQLVLYAVEGSFRSVCRVNPFLIGHHLMFCSLLLLALESQYTFVIKIYIIVSCFATFEFLLYAALIARKLHAPVRITKCLMAAGLVLYGLTRPLQAVLLIGLFVAGYGLEVNTSKGLGLWWTSLVMSVLLSALQCYTFVIYFAIWRRLGHPGAPKARITDSTGRALSKPLPDLEMQAPKDRPENQGADKVHKPIVAPELLSTAASTAELLPHWEPDSSANV